MPHKISPHRQPSTGLKGDENGQNMHIPCMMQIHHLKTAIKKTEQSIKPNVLDCTHQQTSTIYIANGVVITNKIIVNLQI